MRRYGPRVLAGLALVAALVWLGGGLLGGPGGEAIFRPGDAPADAPGAPVEPLGTPPASKDGRPEAPRTARLAGASDAHSTPDPAPGLPSVGVDPSPEDEASSFAAVYTGALPTGWVDAEPAQRPHAVRPPGAGRPRLGGGGRGGVGPTGHWSRFPPPPPPQGASNLLVVVQDEGGRPIPGADVYLGPPATLQQAAVSFGDLRKIGRTGEEGRLLAGNLPAGAAALAGNVANRLNGDRGLDLGSSIPILLLDGRTVRAELILPLTAGDLGRVTGRVTDGQGRPVPRATVTTGYLRVYADEEGRFELAQVPAGLQTLRVSRTGYAPATVEVEVPAGGTRDVPAALAFAETGALRLEGTVRAAEGGEVADAALYLIDDNRRGTLRSIRADADGHYVFEALPDRLSTTACRLQAGKHQAGYRATHVAFAEGIRDPHCDVTLPPRQARVRFVLRDGGSGEAVTRCRIDVERLDDPSTPVRGFMGTNADGRFEHWYDAGSYRFTVEAPDHQALDVDVVLATPGETVEVPVAMSPRGENADPITLRVHVTDASTGAPVTTCRVELFAPTTTDTPVARFEGGAEDGVYSLPAPSGTWRLRLTAEGHEPTEETVTLPAIPPETDLTIVLPPR